MRYNGWLIVMSILMVALTTSGCIYIVLPMYVPGEDERIPQPVNFANHGDSYMDIVVTKHDDPGFRQECRVSPWGHETMNLLGGLYSWTAYVHGKRMAGPSKLDVPDTGKHEIYNRNHYAESVVIKYGRR